MIANKQKSFQLVFDVVWGQPFVLVEKHVSLGVKTQHYCSTVFAKKIDVAYPWCQMRTWKRLPS